jgi:DNA-binding transcriptional LysR family regulator
MSYSPQHLDRLRLRHLRLLEMIDEHGSLRAVGALLNLTQPAVSQMVKDLEYAFDVTLIDRSVRGVTLNAAGKIALQRARSGLASLDHLARELQSDQTPMLRIGANSAMLFSNPPGCPAPPGCGACGHPVQSANGDRGRHDCRR